MSFSGDAWNYRERVSSSLRARNGNRRTSEFCAQASAGARSACEK